MAEMLSCHCCPDGRPRVPRGRGLPFFADEYDVPCSTCGATIGQRCLYLAARGNRPPRKHTVNPHAARCSLWGQIRDTLYDMRWTRRESVTR